jgi:hypothetical protein
VNRSSGHVGTYIMAGIAFIAIGYALQQAFFVVLGVGALGFVVFQRYRDRFGGSDDS